MFTRNRFLAAAVSALLYGALAAGDATAQMMRRMVPPVSPLILPNQLNPLLPVNTLPPGFQQMPVILPVTPTQLVNPVIGNLSTSLADPTLQYVYMLNRYGNYSMPYVAPNYSYTSAYPNGGNTKMHDVVVHLPIATAKVLVNGAETTGTGTSTRHVMVPDGENHEAKIKAVWTIDGKTKADERTIRLNGSGRQVVNFLVPEGK